MNFRTKKMYTGLKGKKSEENRRKFYIKSPPVLRRDRLSPPPPRRDLGSPVLSLAIPVLYLHLPDHIIPIYLPPLAFRSFRHFWSRVGIVVPIKLKILLVSTAQYMRQSELSQWDS
jgi:hypothetical protein